MYLLGVKKEWKLLFPVCVKDRKRSKTLLSQLCNQFMFIRNYAKDTEELMVRIIKKFSEPKSYNYLP